jgi:Uma2 family endonuclease
MIDPALGRPSEPEPDVFVRDVGASLKPPIADVALIVEVSDSTIEDDRGKKLVIYQAAGAREVWLFDLAGQRVGVFRRGQPEQWISAPFEPGATLSPVADPSVVVDIAAVFAAAEQP